MARPTEPAIPTLREARERGSISQGDILASVSTFNQMMNRSSFNAINALVLTKIIYGSEEVLNLLTTIDPAILDELLMKYNPGLATTIQIGGVIVMLQHNEVLPEITAIFGCMNTYPTQFDVPKGQLNPESYPRFSKRLKEVYPYKWRGFLKVITSDKKYLMEMVLRQVPRSLVFMQPRVFTGEPPQQHSMRVPTIIEMDSNTVIPFRKDVISEEEVLFEVPEKPQQTVVTMDGVKSKSRVVSEEEWLEIGPEYKSDESSEEEPEGTPAEEPTFKTRLRTDSETDKAALLFEKQLHERNLDAKGAQEFKETIEGLSRNINEYYSGDYGNEWQDAVIIEAFDVFNKDGGILNEKLMSTTSMDYVENKLNEIANFIKKHYNKIAQMIKGYLRKGVDISKWSEFHRQFYLRYMKDQPFN